MWSIEVDRLPPPANKIYAGEHWAVRKKWVDEWHDELYWLIKGQKIPKMEKIGLEVIEYAKRPRDPDSSWVGAKVFLDSLVLAKVIEDDDYKHVDWVILKSDKAKKDKIVFHLFRIEKTELV